MARWRSVWAVSLIAVVSLIAGLVASVAPAAAFGFSAPTSLVATPGDGSVSISFTAGTGSPSNYEYQLNGGSWTALSPSDTSSPITIPGLTNGTTYAVKIRAVGAILNGTASSEVSVTPAGAPVAPSDLQATPGNGSAEIGFTAGANGGAAITNYKYSTDNGSSWTAFSPAVTSTSVTIGGLTNGTTYSVKLRAVNSAGDGAASDAVLVTPAVVDAVTWTARSAAEANEWRSVTYGNGVFVAVARTGTNRVMTSSDGVTWTARAAAEANLWYSVTYGNGVFVAVAADGTNRVMTSPDGVTWTARAAAAASVWFSVVYGNGVFVAVAAGGPSRVMTSPDGVTWTARAAAEANNWRSVTYGDGVFVAVAQDGTNRVMTSPDGVTWTARAAAAASWQSVTYGNGVFVAGSEVGTVMTSPDGVTWTAQTPVASIAWFSVVYGNGVFVAPTVGGAYRVMTSSDGVTWTARTAAASNSWFSVVYGNGVFVAVAGGGTNRVMTSSLTVAAAAPAAPTSLNATPGNGSASIAFTPGADGGAAITKYQYQVGSGSWTDAVGTSSPITISGLTNGTNSSIKLRAVNSAGDGAASDAVSVTPRTTPAAPTSLVATAGVGSASIAFTPGADGGAAITKYQYKVGNGSWTDAVGTSSPITITGLTNYATVNIRLRAVNAAGAGAASTFVQVWPRIAGSSLTAVTAAGTSSIRVSFAALTPAGGTTSHYWVYAYAKGTNTVAGSCRSTVAARSCVVTGLSANTEYDVAVRGFFTLTGSPTVLPTTDSVRQTVRTRN